MAAYPGGTQVKSGYYVHGKSFEFANIATDGEALPGGSESRWVRIPVLMVMVAAPALGGLFLLSLPLIAVGMTAYAIARKLGMGAKAGAKEIAATVTPAWTPGEAYLAGKPDRVEPGAPARPDAKMDALAAEIEAKRSGKK